MNAKKGRVNAGNYTLVTPRIGGEGLAAGALKEKRPAPALTGNGANPDHLYERWG